MVRCVYRFVVERVVTPQIDKAAVLGVVYYVPYRSFAGNDGEAVAVELVAVYEFACLAVNNVGHADKKILVDIEHIGGEEFVFGAVD